MKKFIFPALLVAASAAALGYYWQHGQNREAVENLQSGGQPLSAQTAPEPSQAPNPVSLPGLAEKNLQGHSLAMEKVLAENSRYVRHYITYMSEGLKISGIMNVPKGQPPAGGFPVLILNHGYIDPAVYTNGRGLKREQDYFAKNGYVVIHPDYRNHAESDPDPEAETNLRLGYVEDAINAALAAKESQFPFIDKNNIGMLGHSMGGGVTVNALVVKPGLVKAAVLLAPVSANAADNFNRWISRRPQVSEKITSLYGSPEQNPKFWQELSAENFLDRVTAPMLIHHGTADSDVPVEWSARLQDKLASQNKQSVLHTYQGQPHEFTSDWQLVMERSLVFFDSHLKQ